MPSPYTGSANGAAQSPSPQPGPGTLPVGSIPLGSDAPTIESISQDFKTLLDYTAYLNTSARIRPPRSPNGGSGFTAVTHTGTGGGAIAPAAVSASLSQPTTTPYNFVFKIVAGGAVATATFAVSLDGGNTYGSTLTTAASYTEPTSGVTVTMSGALVASDLYAFSATDTPIMSYVDANGNTRTIVDHNGFMRPQREELWSIPPATYSATGAITNYLPVNINTIGTGASFQVGYGLGGSMQFSNVKGVSGSAGASTLTLPGGPVCSNTGLVAKMTVDFQLSSATPSSQYTVGLAGPSVFAGSYLAFVNSGGNWLAFSQLLGTSTYLTTNVATSSSVVRFAIEYCGSATPAGACARYFINEKLVAVITTNLPGSTDYLYPGVFCSSGGSESYYIGPMSYYYNRYSNMPGL